MPWTRATIVVGVAALCGLTFMALTGVDSLKGPIFGGWALVALIVGGSKAFPPTRPLPKFRDPKGDALADDGEA